MSMIIETTDSGERVLPKTGLTQAVLTSIISLGTQSWEYQGQPKKGVKVELGFTLPTQTHVWHEEEGPQPFVMYRDVTMSLNTKSILYSIVSGILGKAPEGAFDLESLAGVNCMINVVHVDRNGTTYANMDSFAPLMDTIEPVLSTCNILKLGKDFNQELFDALPDWKKAVIKEAPEYSEIPF